MVDRRILIVGGTGYFGGRLAEALNGEADLHLTQRTVSSRRNAWCAAQSMQAVGFDSSRQMALPVEGDFDAIINLAMPGAVEAARDPDSSLANALTTARACLRLLEDAQAVRLIHFSTFHIYGGPSRTFYAETDAPAPSHTYGKIHLEVERLLLEHACCNRTIVLRPTNLVGAPAHADLGEQSKLLFVDLCRQAAGGSLQLQNDGLSYRDFVPFEDAIAAVRLLLSQPLPGPGPYNLASGTATRVDAIVEAIKDVCDHPVSVAFGIGTDAFRQPFAVSIERLAALGWQPKAELRSEAARCVRFFCA
jgi:nucleoside-diphosphate-sugar epimerase